MINKEKFSAKKVNRIQGSIRDYSYCTFGENSPELLELSSMNKLSLVEFP